MSDNPANELAASIRRAAEEAKSCLVDGFPEQGNRGAIPLVTLDRENAVRLISAARPKAIYLIEVPFDPEEEITEATQALLELGVDKAPPKLAAALRRAATHAGEIRTTLSAFVVDGVLHTSSASAEWHDAFDEIVDGVLADAAEDAQSRGHRQSCAASAEIAAKAKTLAAHPSFGFGRVSFEKRLTLAMALFDGADEEELREATREAENLFWLAQSGFKAGA